MKAFPDKAIKFASFEEAKSILSYRHWDKKINTYDILYAGLFASFIAHLTIYPIEVIRVRLSADLKNNYNGAFDCLWKLIKTEGVCTLYKGMMPWVLSSLPSPAFNLFVYDKLKTKVIFETHYLKYGSPTIMAIGTTSAFITFSLLYPFHVIKSRIIINGKNKDKIQKKGTLPMIIRNTYEREGILGFYKGFLPGIMKTGPSHGISFTAYEFFKSLMQVGEIRRY